MGRHRLDLLHVRTDSKRSMGSCHSRSHAPDMFNSKTSKAVNRSSFRGIRNHVFIREHNIQRNYGPATSNRGKYNVGPCSEWLYDADRNFSTSRRFPNCIWTRASLDKI